MYNIILVTGDNITRIVNVNSTGCWWSRRTSRIRVSLCIREVEAKFHSFLTSDVLPWS